MTEGIAWFLATVALVVGFTLGLLVGRRGRHRASRVNVHSAERRRMFIKQGDL